MFPAYGGCLWNEQSCIWDSATARGYVIGDVKCDVPLSGCLLSSHVSYSFSWTIFTRRDKCVAHSHSHATRLDARIFANWSDFLLAVFGEQGNPSLLKVTEELVVMVIQPAAPAKLNDHPFFILCRKPEARI